MKKTKRTIVSTLRTIAASGAVIGMSFAGFSPSAVLAAPPVAESGFTANTTSGSSLTLTKPSGVQAGDLLVVLVGNDDSTGTAQWNNSAYKPSGFSLVNEVGGSVSDCHAAAFVRVADGTEGATVNVPAQSSDDYWGYYIRVTGVDTAVPVNAIGSGVDVSSAKSIDISGVTTSVDESLAFYVSCYDGADGNPFSIESSGWSEVAEAQTSGGANGAGGSWGTKTLAAAGATGTATVSSNTKDGFSGFQFAIAAAVVPPPSVFGSPTSYAIGSSTKDVAAADFDHDGDFDIAVTQANAAAGLAVLLNNGDGTYATPATYATGDGPYAVAVTDVDDDTYADIVVTNSASSDSVSVFLNNGDGTFAAKVDYAAGSGVYAVAAADVNGDSAADIVAGNYSAATISVLLNNGDGTFGSATTYGTGSGTSSVALVDVDGDTNADVVTANATDNTVSVLLNNGDGTFGSKTDYAVGTVPRNAAIADLDGDSAPDIVSANYYRVDGIGSGDSVSVLLNNGDGTFGSAVNYAMGDGAWDVALADLDSDSIVDVVTADFEGHTVSVRLGNGDGTLGDKTSYATGYQPIALALADVDGDELLDAITADSAFGNVSVLLNTGN